MALVIELDIVNRQDIADIFGIRITFKCIL